MNGVQYTQETVLNPSGLVAYGSLFGTSVDIDGDVIVVGAPGDTGSAEDSGAAHIYRHNGEAWVHEQKVFAAVGSSSGPVAVSGDVVAVGRHLFRYDGVGSWVAEPALTDAQGAPFTLNGAVDLDGDVLYDIEEKVFPDIKAEPGQKAFIFIHTVPYEG